MTEADRIKHYVNFILGLNVVNTDIDWSFVTYLEAHPKFKKFWNIKHITATEIKVRHETCQDIIKEIRKEYDSLNRKDGD